MDFLDRGDKIESVFKAMELIVCFLEVPFLRMLKR